MSFTQWLRTKRGQRIDQRDFQAGIDSPRSAVREDLDAFLHGGATEKAYLLSGGGMSFASGNITIQPMVAVGPIRDGQGIQYGQVVTTQAAKTIAIGSDNVVKGIYVRFQMQPVAYANRAFWNPNATPSPAEYTAPLHTRQQVDWQITLQETSPGVEWMKLGEVNPSNPGATFSDQRPFFFEDNDLGVVPDDAWGGGNDRSAVRSTYGIHGLRRFCVSVYKVLAEMKGHKWFETLATGGSKSMLALNQDKLEHDGSNDVTGNIRPDTDGIRDFGSTSRRFANIHARTAFVVHENGDFAYEVAQSGSVMIPSLSVEFSGSNASVIKTLAEAAVRPAQAACLQAIAGVGLFSWDLHGHIPFGGFYGVILNSVTLDYVISVVGANATTTVEVQRYRLDGSLAPEALHPGGPITLASASFTGFTINLTQNNVVDPSVYGYRVLVKIDSAGDSESIILSSLVLNYSAQALRP